MEVPFNKQFERQRRRYTLRFTCEFCVNFDEIEGVCIHGFPNKMHRLNYYEADPPPRMILFCKEFDLV